MEVEAAPAIRDKKRFEVKKVEDKHTLLRAQFLLTPLSPYLSPSSGMLWLYGHGVSLAIGV